MRDISGKTTSLRTAKVLAVVSCSQETLERIQADNLPKGNLLDVARSAGLLASKQTHNLIPHSHSISIDALDISYSYIENGECSEDVGTVSAEYGIAIIVQGKSISRTGIETVLLTAASISALTIYDLLEPLDCGVEIMSTRLLEKDPEKNKLQKVTGQQNKVAVLICSDSVAAGRKKDRTGPIIGRLLEEHNADVIDYKIMPDRPEAIQAQLNEWSSMNIPFVFTVGGTGIGPKDRVVDAVKAVIERETPGIVEAMELHGLQRTPLAMMSRLTAGVLKGTLIVTLPGSSDGLRQSLEGLLPGVFYAKKMLRTATMNS
ncbi:bifunctional molybdenum cofactor biosynthesis protein MoaC/MoaB [Aliifodinibius sp. S!AR15-10]|uniref:bifunctional molybdenum cofactor biosynthesis protein MoaC/MoaB n=1 Tax=Aliifodinibius sp. S!AR15-10 TaxID=2950437 RepID=UPI0028547EAC|nr:bifunctional molybdenum cofactor biosynthesis protein MoaC/MoaB [Aliifodinibius sp. S!AR15-10]MDR8394146.1 bifunctional molybdenum cofactor biosynthesis protein MoaC/MoaB [Aliifodinibius sp. S!AR15-10]